MKFWDTSALIGATVDEPHRQFAKTILQADEHMAVWWGTSIEYVSAIARRERDGSISDDEVVRHLDMLKALARVWFEVQPSQQIKLSAQRLLRVHPLRAADSLQLAAAVAASEGDPSSVDFVCLDERLNRAASREGFTVLSR